MMAGCKQSKSFYNATKLRLLLVLVVFILWFIFWLSIFIYRWLLNPLLCLSRALVLLLQLLIAVNRRIAVILGLIGVIIYGNIRLCIGRRLINRPAKLRVVVRTVNIRLFITVSWRIIVPRAYSRAIIARPVELRVVICAAINGWCCIINRRVIYVIVWPCERAVIII